LAAADRYCAGRAPIIVRAGVAGGAALETIEPWPAAQWIGQAVEIADDPAGAAKAQRRVPVDAIEPAAHRRRAEPPRFLRQPRRAGVSRPAAQRAIDEQQIITSMAHGRDHGRARPPGKRPVRTKGPQSATIARPVRWHP